MEQKKKGAPKGTPSKLKGKSFPDKWRSGTDEYKHSMYMPWLRAKAQANYRKEGWDLPFEAFYELWKGDWNNRGRLPTNVCMARKDYAEAWTVENTEIILRSEHLARQNFLRSSEGSSYYKRGPVGRPPTTTKLEKPIKLFKVKK